MKKLLLTAFLCTALLCACGETTDAPASGESVTAVEVNEDAVLAQITETYSLTDGFVFTSSSTELGEYLDEDMIMGYYGDAVDVPDFSKVASYCVYIDESNPDLFIDVGLFRMNDPSYADTLMQYFQARIDDKIAAADLYPDTDVPTLEAATVAKYGDFVYYVVSPDVDAITADLEAALGK